MSNDMLTPMTEEQRLKYEEQYKDYFNEVSNIMQSFNSLTSEELKILWNNVRLKLQNPKDELHLMNYVFMSMMSQMEVEKQASQDLITKNKDQKKDQEQIKEQICLLNELIAKCSNESHAFIIETLNETKNKLEESLVKEENKKPETDSNEENK